MQRRHMVNIKKSTNTLRHILERIMNHIKHTKISSQQLFRIYQRARMQAAVKKVKKIEYKPVRTHYNANLFG